VILLTPHMRILVAVEPADFRRGTDGLAMKITTARTAVLESSMEELRAILQHARELGLAEKESATLEALVDSYALLLEEIGDKQATLGRLRQLLFGATTEKTKEVVGTDRDLAPAGCPAGLRHTPRLLRLPAGRSAARCARPQAHPRLTSARQRPWPDGGHTACCRGKRRPARLPEAHYRGQLLVLSPREAFDHSQELRARAQGDRLQVCPFDRDQGGDAPAPLRDDGRSLGSVKVASPSARIRAAMLRPDLQAGGGPSAMTITVRLTADLEDRLSREAERQGVELEAYTLRVLEEHVPPSERSSRAAALLQSWIEEQDEEEQRGTGEYLIRALDDDRPSERRLFPPELKGVTW